MYFLTFEMPSFVFDLFDGNVTVFILGFLFTLYMYHFLLFFQHNDRTYLYYSLYTFIIFIYILPKANSFFLSGIIDEYKSALIFISYPLQWSMYVVYLFFVKEFLSLKQYSPKRNNQLNYILYGNIMAIIASMIYANHHNSTELIGTVFYIYVSPLLIVISIFLLYVISKIDNHLKYYILIGSVFYLSFSTFSLYLIINHVPGNLIVFYVAIVVENIFFALGLGAKLKKILIDQNIMQQQLIEEHIKNINLQKEIKTKLDNEVTQKTERIIALTKKNKEEHKQKLASEFSKRTLNLRMKALQTQMNPHFLYNSLNAIKLFIIKNKKEEAAYFLSKLSRLLREILDNSQQQEITLKKELEIMQLYLEVENIRLNKNIEMKINLPDSINSKNIKIPPLILQPFIENAIWHGLALKKGAKKISITITLASPYLDIYIEDNGIGREKASVLKKAKLVEKDSFGIQLSKERLQTYTEHFKQKVSISFEDLYEEKKASGTRVLIRIPFI